jgi:Na+/H+ antiporter NhaD/arsenite permease-like protein
VTPETDSNNRAVLALMVLLLAYVAAVIAGIPQRATARISAQQQEMVDSDPSVSDALTPLEVPTHKAISDCPPLWMILPFVLLLIAIAILPLTPRASHWWESNLHKLLVAGGLSLLTLGYYLLIHRQGVLGNWPIKYLSLPAVTGPSWNLAGTTLSNALLSEYLPFILLLFSLYTITGGIRIEGDLPAHSLTNTAFLGVGAVLASLIGTTGASMLLIRPLLETNSERKHVQHTIVMFIFIVCNCGGCLLPLGDPPLFLGYLFGVPFLWTLRLWPAWLLVNGLLLLIYFVWDHFWCYPQEAVRDVQRDETTLRPMRFRGLWPNVPLLVGVIASVALLDPGKPFLGTNWHPWVYLREAVQSGLVLVSLCCGTGVRRDNGFSYGAILEVAVLFLGIFVCMQSPLDILHVRGASLGLATPAHFFWASGSLSSVLDNAPTYAVYFETARSLGGQPAIAGVQEKLLAAVSLGSVFMGAMTYIGNGPNFMVKSIAEKAGVAMPSFFGYIFYSLVILLPLFALVTVVILR